MGPKKALSQSSSRVTPIRATPIRAASQRAKQKQVAEGTDDEKENYVAPSQKRRAPPAARSTPAKKQSTSNRSRSPPTLQILYEDSLY